MITLVGPTNRQFKSMRLVQEALGDTRAFPDSLIYWGRDGEHSPQVLGSGRGLGTIEQYAKLRAAGIACPTITTSYEEALEWLRQGKEVWGRTNKHTQAKDVIAVGGRLGVPADLTMFATKDYWLVPLDTVVEEWRIHVVKGKVIARGKKVHALPSTLPFLARNRRNGWHMVHTEEPRRGMRKFARDCVEAVGYDFGAVDVGLLAGTPRPSGSVYDLCTCFEVNRAPGCDNYTASAYANAFKKVVMGEL